MLKSYQLLHETQLPQTECAMLHVTMNGQTRRPSKLSDKCMASWRIDHPGVSNRSQGPSVNELYCQHPVVTSCRGEVLAVTAGAINNDDHRPYLLIY